MLLSRALIDGLIFSVMFGGMVSLIEILNPRYELHNYPQEIRKSVKPKTKEEQKRFKLLAVPMLLILFIFLMATVIHSYIALDVSYFVLFLHYLIIFMTWNIFDLLIMDWLIFCTLTPKFLIIPGTENNPAYKDFKFHLKGDLGKGTVLAFICAIFTSGICFLLLRLF
ncbi:MAG: hypothetical protein Q8920_04795 [Bacillota bacterium]|nr:hypothetical protein [Bacillota bacterium]